MITVSIVVHNTPESQLNRVIDCILPSKVHKIYIIDNSESEDLFIIADRDPRIEYLHVENRGFGAGHNIAISNAEKIGARYHLVLNADVYWDDDIIPDLEKYMDENPDVGLVSPKTYYPNGDLQFTCRKLPTPQDLFFKRFLPKKFSRKRMTDYLLMNHDHDRELNCPYLLGSFMFFRMETLKETGKFDERFFLYPEDIDITRRLHEKWKTMYWPGVTIVHEHQQASKKSLKMFRIHLVNMIKYFNKWGWLIDKKRKKNNSNLSQIENHKK